MHACCATGGNHLLYLCFIAHPVRIEHAGHTRHSQHISIGLQDFRGIIDGRSITPSKKISHLIIRGIAIECVMVIDKEHCIFAIAFSTETGIKQFTIIAGTNTVSKGGIVIGEIEKQGILRGIIHTGLERISVAVPIFPNGEIGFRGIVVIIDMLQVESSDIVIAPSVIANLGFHPFEIGFEHILYLRIGMVPVASGTVVLIITVLTVIGATASTMSFIIGSGP